AAGVTVGNPSSDSRYASKAASAGDGGTIGGGTTEKSMCPVLGLTTRLVGVGTVFGGSNVISSGTGSRGRLGTQPSPASTRAIAAAPARPTRAPTTTGARITGPTSS